MMLCHPPRLDHPDRQSRLQVEGAAACGMILPAWPVTGPGAARAPRVARQPDAFGVPGHAGDLSPATTITCRRATECQTS